MGKEMGAGTDAPKRVKLVRKTSPSNLGVPPGCPLPKKPTVSPPPPLSIPTKLENMPKASKSHSPL